MEKNSPRAADKELSNGSFRQAGTQDSDALRPLDILIVEDEALLAMELEALVEEEGHVVRAVASSAREARKRATDTRFDVAFVDINLADGPTGLDLARDLTESAYVVFVTASAPVIPPDFCGAAGVVSKPYTVRGLSDALRFLQQGVCNPPPAAATPSSLRLAPQHRWRAQA